jgi:pyruvate dehydrogenase E2 component (dihydrolipoamide acetyltransferase)
VLLVKAAAMALAQHPVVNASCRDGKSFSYSSSVNVAVAVAIEGGLLTPVLEDADKVLAELQWLCCLLSNAAF